MIKKGLVLGTLALALAGGSYALACEAHAKQGGKHEGGCPMHVAGAVVKVEKVDGGVVIRVTGADAATVAKIQAAGEKTAAAGPGKTGCAKCAGKTASAPKAGVYACSMEDYAGPMTKDGRCPKCGMALSLKK